MNQSRSWRSMTAAEVLSELAALLADPDFGRDPLESLRQWATSTLGMRPPAEPVPMSQLERRRVALSMVREHGEITSGQLAEACGVSSEAARLDLVALADARYLVRRGRWRHTRYVPGPQMGRDRQGERLG